MLLRLAFLFFIGSTIGWVLEVFFRKFFSKANPGRKWINPGFCTGPWLPLYGAGLCLLYLIASTEQTTNALITHPIWNKIVLFIFMSLCMTAMEYVTGCVCYKSTKVRLWDYREEWGNINGFICPKFSFFWAVLGALYYFIIHPHILGALQWLSENLAFSFFIGLFFGVFLIDVIHSTRIVTKIKKFAQENNIVVRYELLKAQIRLSYEQNKLRYSFLNPFRTTKGLSEYLREHLRSFEKIKDKIPQKKDKAPRTKDKEK